MKIIKISELSDKKYKNIDLGILSNDKGYKKALNSIYRRYKNKEERDSWIYELKKSFIRSKKHYKAKLNRKGQLILIRSKIHPLFLITGPLFPNFNTSIFLKGLAELYPIDSNKVNQDSYNEWELKNKAK